MCQSKQSIISYRCLACLFILDMISFKLLIYGIIIIILQYSLCIPLLLAQVSAVMCECKLIKCTQRTTQRIFQTVHWILVPTNYCYFLLMFLDMWTLSKSWPHCDPNVCSPKRSLLMSMSCKTYLKLNILL